MRFKIIAIFFITLTSLASEPKLSCNIQDKERGDISTKIIKIAYYESLSSEFYEYEFDMKYQKLKGTDKKFRISSSYQLLEDHELGEDASNLIINLFVGKSSGGSVDYESLELEELPPVNEEIELQKSGVTITCKTIL